MKIVVKGTRLTLTPALSNYLKRKLLHLDKFGVNIQIARVELEATTDKNKNESFRAEVNLDAGRRVYRAEVEHADMYAAIDLVIPKLINQLEKSKLKKIATARRQARRIKNV